MVFIFNLVVISSSVSWRIENNNIGDVHVVYAQLFDSYLVGRDGQTIKVKCCEMLLFITADKCGVISILSRKIRENR